VDALISIDQYAFGEDAERKNRWRLRLTERLAHDAQRVRMLGSSAIDLAWTAEGRLDACVQFGNKPWDTSAGVLIAREAGARVLDHDGSEHSHSPAPRSRSRAGVHGRTSTPWALLSAKELGCGLDDFTGARVACSAGRALEHTTWE